MTKEFKLKGYEFIELKNLLKILDYVNSGGEAKFFIQEGNVVVNGEEELRRGKKLREGDTVEVLGDKILISK